MTFEEWADRTFGSKFKLEDPLTYCRMSAAWEKGQEDIERLRQRVQELDQLFRVCNSMLIESQAREAKLHEALNRIANDDHVTCQETEIKDRCMWVAEHALELTTDNTALKE